MEVYIDANCVGFVTYRRFTSRYCVFLGENFVIWRSENKNVVARSRVEAKF